jgi:protein-S-isoprenylcysteine O-methyltransferase Ste14
MMMERRRLLDDPADLCARALIGTLFLVLAWRLGGDFARTHRVTDLLLLVGEGLVVVLTLLRRHARVVDRRFFVRVATAVSMVSPFLVRPGPVGGLLPEPISIMIAAAGLSIVVAGKLSLGYSFGLLPAHRGVVDGGVYRFVRHPIYVGYLLSHVGFLFSHPTFWNLGAFMLGDITLIVRAIFEEQTLATDSAYVRYCQQVRWRLLPGVY